MANDAIQAETTMIRGYGGDTIQAYYARPLDPAPRGGVVLIHHMPGYDAGTKEMARTFAVNGFAAIVPNLYYRDAPDASPDDAAAFVRGNGGVPDERLVGDVQAAADHIRGLPTSNGKVGVIGHCSGGRQSVLAACSITLEAAVDCYGAFVLGTPPDGFPLRTTSLEGKLADLSAPLLGLFGNDDKYPAPDEVLALDKLLTDLGKDHEFHSYDGAGHAFMATSRPSYRPEAATDAWAKILAFYGRHLGA